MKRFGGIHSVLFALFDARGDVDLGAMRAQAQLMYDLGVDGVNVLGLATEVGKLREQERQDIMREVGAELGGCVPYSVTISGNSVAEQREGIACALDSGADWLILQPPGVGTYPGSAYLDFFSAVSEGFETTFALQNAPEYLGRGLDADEIATLKSRVPGFEVLKAEAPAIDFENLVSNVGESLTLLNGRGGLQMIDCLAAGADGFILAPDLIDYAQKCSAEWRAGNETAALSHQQMALPAISFVMQSLEHLICYGKRLFGLRAGFTIYDRLPALLPSEFGLQRVEAYAEHLGPITSKNS